jgi:hypothetical protein
MYSIVNHDVQILFVSSLWKGHLQNGTLDSIQPRNGEDPKLTPQQAESIYAPCSSAATGLESDGRSPQDNGSSAFLYRHI